MSDNLDSMGLIVSFSSHQKIKYYWTKLKQIDSQVVFVKFNYHQPYDGQHEVSSVEIEFYLGFSLTPVSIWSCLGLMSTVDLLVEWFSCM